MTEGQTLRFSECNPNIQDKTCENTICQFCVNEISSGVYCPASLNQCNSVCISYEERSDEDLPVPVITIRSPSELFVSEDETFVDFTFDVTRANQIGSRGKCKLYLDDVNVAESTSSIRLSNNVIRYFVESGSYSWKISCTTGLAPIVTVFSETRRLSVALPPQNETDQNQSENQSEQENTIFPISLISPVEGFPATDTQSLEFVYNFTNSSISNINRCNLILNNEPVSSNQTILYSNQTNSIIYSVSPNSYSWKINCTSNNNSTISSNARSFTISSPSAPSSGSSGGGGGSSSSGTIFLNSNSSNQTLEFENLSASDEKNETISEEEQTNNSPGITGGVIGVAKKYKFPLIGLGVIVAAWIIIYLVRKNTKVQVD